MKKIITLVLTFLMVAVLVSAQEEKQLDEKQKKQIEFLSQLGALKYGNTCDASGSRPLMMMTMDNTGTAMYQHVTASDSKNIEETLAQHGMIKFQINKKTGLPEKHILVFNPKDVHTYVWVPLSEARAVAKQIQETGKTVLEEKPPRRLNEKDMFDMNFETSF